MARMANRLVGGSSSFVSLLILLLWILLFVSSVAVIVVVDGFSPSSSSSSSTYSYSSKQQKYHCHHHPNKKREFLQADGGVIHHHDNDNGVTASDNESKITTNNPIIINEEEDDNNKKVIIINDGNNNNNNNKSIRRQIQRSYNKLREFCTNCKRPIQQCVCSALPTEPLNLHGINKILIIQHPKEFKKRKTISTVPLIELVLGKQKVEICIGTSLDVANNIIDTAINNTESPNQKPLLLFPSSNSIPLNEISHIGLGQKGRRNNESSSSSSSSNSNNNYSNSSSSSSYILILVDGTWGQARRMIRDTSIELLDKCCMVQFSSSSSSSEAENEEADNDDSNSIDDVKPSNNKNNKNNNIKINNNKNIVVNKSTYGKIRQQPHDYCLSTLEACAKALPYLLEGSEEKDHDQQQHLVPSQYLLQTLELFVNIQIGYEIKQQQQRIIDDYQQSKSSSSEGYHLRLLSTKDDAEFVNNNWQYQSGKKSLKMIGNYIGNNTNIACLGIEFKFKNLNQTTSSEELVGCIIRYPYTGALGMLYVDPNHRRKGLASILLQTAIQIIITSKQQYNFNKMKNNDNNNANDDDPNQTTTTQNNCFCYILDGNIASESLFKKHGFIREEDEEDEASTNSRDSVSSGKTNKKKKRGTGRRRSKRKWILP